MNIDNIFSLFSQLGVEHLISENKIIFYDKDSDCLMAIPSDNNTKYFAPMDRISQNDYLTMYSIRGHKLIRAHFVLAQNSLIIRDILYSSKDFEQKFEFSRHTEELKIRTTRAENGIIIDENTIEIDNRGVFVDYVDKTNQTYETYFPSDTDKYGFRMLEFLNHEYIDSNIPGEVARTIIGYYENICPEIKTALESLKQKANEKVRI